MRIKSALPAIVVVATAIACGVDDVTNAVFGETTQATPNAFTAIMFGAAQRAVESPSNATGSATLGLNADGDITYTVTVEGLEARATGVHIHGPADTRDAAPIIVELRPVVSVTSGVVASGVIHQANLPSVSLEELRDLMRRGLTYIDVHSSRYFSGEIRGQIKPQ